MAAQKNVLKNIVIPAQAGIQTAHEILHHIQLQL